MKDSAIRIAMWSGPRNISTTMMRAFENRADTAVSDEPFYASYLLRSGADHPYRNETIAAQAPTIEAAVDRLSAPPSTFGKPRASILFMKHIAYHLPESVDFGFTQGWRNFILIRDPALMAASYARKLDDLSPIARSYDVAMAIRAHLSAHDIPCPIVDAADILADPRSLLGKLCGALDIPFDEAMLSWPSGRRESDGPWAPHWYDAVWSSTGFRAPVEKPADAAEMSNKCASPGREVYDFLHSLRL
jgi:hypothetical protein